MTFKSNRKVTADHDLNWNTANASAMRTLKTFTVRSLKHRTRSWAVLLADANVYFVV